MVDFTQTATAGSNGTATVTFEPINPGLLWVVSQISYETVPFRVGCSQTTRRNGRYVTSSIIGSGDTAFGPPAIVLYRGNLLSIVWSGLTAGDEAIGTIYYTEQPWSASPSAASVV